MPRVTRSSAYHVSRSVTDFRNRKQEYCSMSLLFNVTRRGTARCLRAYIAVSPQTHCNPSSFYCGLGNDMLGEVYCFAVTLVFSL